MVATRPIEAVIDLLGPCFQFLHAQHIGLLPREPAEKALASRRSQAICIERDYSQSGHSGTFSGSGKV
jgi:hypothetical protein